MKKIGIITIHKINNYGALAQAYALNYYLRSSGHDVKTIDFRTYRVAESYKIFLPIKSVMNVVRNLQSLLYYGKLKRRNKRFDTFLSQYVPMTDKAYYSEKALQEEIFDFDAYICGSDQIWNVCPNYSPAFILRFAKDKGRRISYAASMGGDSIAKEKYAEFSEELSKFDYLSVREDYAIPLIAELSGKPPMHVCDPVFLLSETEWGKIAAERQTKRPYIFFYFVRGDMPQMREYVIKLSKETGLDIVVVTKGLREMRYSNKKFYDAGPTEFISLVQNAEYVCTNSFHGTAFSIIFKRKFLAFAPIAESKSTSSSRIYSVLQKFGLEERVYNGKGDISQIQVDIDYDSVYEKLTPFVNSSKAFLIQALQDGDK